MAEDVQTLSTCHADCREQQAQLKTYGGETWRWNIFYRWRRFATDIQYYTVYIYYIYIFYNILYIYTLVGGLEHFLFFHVLGIIIPTD